MALGELAEIVPDAVVSFDLRPGTLDQFLRTRSEKGPRLTCVEGSVTLVSPGRSHEVMARRLDLLVLAVCAEVPVRVLGLESSTWSLPAGTGDTAYEADKAYVFARRCEEPDPKRPDLAIEVVVSHPETKALRAAAVIGIPELWVLDLNREHLAFYRLEPAEGLEARTYVRVDRSQIFGFLSPSDVLDRLERFDQDDVAFMDACRTWARDRLRAESSG